MMLLSNNAMYDSCLSTISLTHVHLKTDLNLIPSYSTETRLIFLSLSLLSHQSIIMVFI